jgi:hypothetical protein
MVNVGIFYGLLEYFMAIWYNLWPFGTVCVHLLYFYQFVCLEQEKSGNPERPGIGGMETAQKNPLRSGQLNFYN